VGRRRGLLLRQRNGWDDAFNGDALSARLTVVRGTPSVSGGVLSGDALGMNDALWILSQQLGSETYVLSLAQCADGSMVAGTLPTGQVYRSTDNGASWSLVQRLGSEERVYSLAQCADGSMVAGTSPSGQVYRAGAVLSYAPAWPHVRIRTTVTAPSSGKCPLHLVFRADDGLNYSMVRLHPVTAGNDTHIIERVAGAETTRASADVDLAASTSYDVRVDVRGSNVAVYVDGVLATSYASAVNGTYRNVGIELLDTSGRSVSMFRVEEI